MQAHSNLLANILIQLNITLKITWVVDSKSTDWVTCFVTTKESQILLQKRQVCVLPMVKNMAKRCHIISPAKNLIKLVENYQNGEFKQEIV